MYANRTEQDRQKELLRKRMEQQQEEREQKHDGSIEKLYQLISQGNKRIGDQRKDKAILIMGETGAGKSTLALLFAGKALRAVNKAGSLVVEEVNPEATGSEDGDIVKISHKKVSQTKIPSQVTSESGLVVWDCPGFGDLGREPIQDIANAFYIQRLFETSKELKLVLAVSWYDMQGRSGQLLKIVDHFVKLFKDIKEIRHSVSLVATQVPSHVTTENIKEIIDAILEDNQSIEARSRQMLGYLTSSIAIFYTPTAVGVLEKMVGALPSASGASVKENPILSSIEGNTNYLRTNAGAANVVISQTSEKLANDLFTTSNAQLLDLLRDVAQKISQICQKINSKGNEIKIESGYFEVAYNFLGKVLTGTDQRRYATPSYKELLNLNCIITFESFCEFMTKPQQDIQRWLINIDEKVTDVTNALKQYYEQIPILDAQIKEKIKYVQFLSKVWSGQLVQQKNYISVFSECARAVNQAAQKGVESLDVKKNEPGLEYYQAVIKFLNKYPQITACIEKNKLAQYEMGKIYHNMNNYDMAAKCYIESIRLEEEIAKKNNPYQSPHSYYQQPQNISPLFYGAYNVPVASTTQNSPYLAKDLDNPYRKLDAIYFAIKDKDIKKISIDKELAKKLLEFNLQVLKKLIEEKIIKYINDYIGARRYREEFLDEKDDPQLVFFDNLRLLLNTFENIASNYSTLKAKLNTISSILNKDCTITPVRTDRSATVCESIYSFDSEDPLEIKKLHAQIDYIVFLQTASNMTDTSTQLSSLFNAKTIDEALLNKLKSIQLNTQEKSEYYNRIIKQVSSYPNDKDCVRLNAHANLCLAKQSTNNMDKIKFYKNAIAKNDQLLELCKRRDTGYYAQYSIKREACETLGDIYFQQGSFKEAIEQFKLIDSHIKVKTCYKKLLEANQNPQGVREQFADYLSTKGMFDSALDYYHEVLSLSADRDTHIRINNKMYVMLDTKGNKWSEYKTRASNIESNYIVYSVANSVHDNPLIAVLPNLKAKPSDLNKLLTMTDFMVKNGQRDLVEYLVNTYQDEELFAQIQRYYASSSVPYNGQSLHSYQRSIKNDSNDNVVTPVAESTFKI